MLWSSSGKLFTPTLHSARADLPCSSALLKKRCSIGASLICRTSAMQSRSTCASSYLANRIVGLDDRKCRALFATLESHAGVVGRFLSEPLAEGPASEIYINLRRSMSLREFDQWCKKLLSLVNEVAAGAQVQIEVTYLIRRRWTSRAERVFCLRTAAPAAVNPVP